jgi:hypothetical protein
MKSKNTIGILVAIGLIAVLVILIIVFNASKGPIVEPEAVTPEAPASEVTAPPVDTQPPLDPKDVIAPIVKKVLEETDALYERTLVAYKTNGESISPVMSMPKRGVTLKPSSNCSDACKPLRTIWKTCTRWPGPMQKRETWHKPNRFPIGAWKSLPSFPEPLC